MIRYKIICRYILRLPLIILYIVVILDLFLLSSRVGKFNDDIILVTLLNLDIVAKYGCSPLDGFKLVYVGVGVGAQTEDAYSTMGRTIIL